MTLGSKAVSFLSGEWMLGSGRPNGGDVVIFRTVWVGLLLILLMAAIKTSATPLPSVCAFVESAWGKALEMLRSSEGPVIFGAVYAALYARFASQWTYMANLYNQIKQAEVTMQPATAGQSASVQTSPPLAALAQWKAGFIEDALAVHMATKPSVAGVIKAWHSDPAVLQALNAYTTNWQIKERWLKTHKVVS